MRSKRKNNISADPYGIQMSKYIIDHICKHCIFNTGYPESNDEQDEDENECQTKYNYTHKTPKEWKKYKCINFKSKVVQENNTQHSLPIVDPDTTGTHKDDCVW